MWTIPLDNVDTQQILLYLPLVLSEALPPTFQAEFKQLSANQLQLTFVSPKTPARAKRYKVVRHNSAAWVSIPRPWLRDRSAKQRDTLRVTQSSADVFLIDFKRT